MLPPSGIKWESECKGDVTARLAQKTSRAEHQLMSRTAWWRGEEDRRLMEGGSWHEPQKDERSGNIQQPWGFRKKCKCFNIKVWQLLAASSHSSFICCTSFLLLKYILCPDIKPFTATIHSYLKKACWMSGMEQVGPKCRSTQNAHLMGKNRIK